MFEIKIIAGTVTLAELKAMAEQQFGSLVKAVVDVERKTMATGGELHADEEAAMLDAGSKQENPWGINIYPELDGNDKIEFDSMIIPRVVEFPKERDVLLVNTEHSTLQLFENLSCFGITSVLMPEIAPAMWRIRNCKSELLTL